MPMHPNIKDDAARVGPYAVVVTQDPGENEHVLFVAPDGGFKTKDEAIEFSAYWAGVVDGQRDGHVFKFVIVTIQDLGSFMKYMSF